MSSYKNIASIRYLGGDTDSVFLSRRLPQHVVGSGLGMMKLEYEIKEGLLADKKLYYHKDVHGNIVIRSRGVGLNLAGKNILTPQHFFELLAGKDVKVEKTKIFIKDTGVFIVNIPLSVKIRPEEVMKAGVEIRKILASSYCATEIHLAKRILGEQTTSLVLYGVKASLAVIYYNKPILSVVSYIQPQHNIITINNLSEMKCDNIVITTPGVILCSPPKVTQSHAVQAKAKALLTKKNVSFEISLLDNTTGMVHSFKSIREAERVLGVSSRTIRRRYKAKDSKAISGKYVLLHKN